jgi:hypothetical protein
MKSGDLLSPTDFNAAKRSKTKILTSSAAKDRISNQYSDFKMSNRENEIQI